MSLGLRPGCHLESRRHRAVHLVQAITINDSEVVPEIELELGLALASDAMDHFAERALELFEVLFRRKDLVDLGERLQLLRILIECCVVPDDGFLPGFLISEL